GPPPDRLLDRPAGRLVVVGEARVIGRFLGDDDIVRVALLDRGAGDRDEPGLGPEFFDGAGAAVAHAGAEAADELEDEIGERALVGDPAVDAFGDELLGRLVLGVRRPGGSVLAVAVVGPLGHGADGAHAAIRLEAAAAVDDRLAGALGQPGEQAADH